MEALQLFLQIIKKARFNMISARLGLHFSGTILLIFMVVILSREWDLYRQSKGIQAIHESFPINLNVVRGDSTVLITQKMANHSAVLDSMDTILSTPARQKAFIETTYSFSNAIPYLFASLLYCWIYLKHSRRRPGPNPKKRRKAKLHYPPFDKVVKYGLNITVSALLLFTLINTCMWYARQDRLEKIAALKRCFHPNWTGIMKKDSTEYFVRQMQNKEDVFNMIDTEPLLTTDVRPLYAAELVAIYYALLSFALFLCLSVIWQATYKVFIRRLY